MAGHDHSIEYLLESFSLALLLDCRSGQIFEKLRRKKGGLVSSYGIKREGYRELNKLAVKMYKTLEKEVLKKKRR